MIIRRRRDANFANNDPVIVVAMENEPRQLRIVDDHT